MKLERSIEQYRNSNPSVIAEGSKAQIIFALEDSRTDVLRLAAHVERLEANQSGSEILEVLKELCIRIGPRWFLEQNWSAPLDVIAKAEATE